MSYRRSTALSLKYGAGAEVLELTQKYGSYRIEYNIVRSRH
jgi:hypothetical protein